MNTKPKGNDVIGRFNVSLMARRFRELREEEQRKVVMFAARGGKMSAKEMADAGIAAGRAQAFADAATIMDAIELEMLAAKASP